LNEETPLRNKFVFSDIKESKVVEHSLATYVNSESITLDGTSPDGQFGKCWRKNA
jgi:hypothetical protein